MPAAVLADRHRADPVGPGREYNPSVKRHPNPGTTDTRRRVCPMRTTPAPYLSSVDALPSLVRGGQPMQRAGARPLRALSVAVRGKPTVPLTVHSPGRRPLYVRGHRNTGVYSGPR
jgi:hypothetical protein